MDKVVAPTLTLAHNIVASSPVDPTASRIPVIDFAAFLAGDGKRRVSEHFREACEGTGFFYLTGHGVPLTAIDAIFAASRRFFARPLEERMKVRLTVGPNRGYQPLGSRIYADKADAPDLNESFKYQHDCRTTIRTSSPATGCMRVTAGRAGCRDGGKRCSTTTPGWSGSPTCCCGPSHWRSTWTRHGSSRRTGNL